MNRITKKLPALLLGAALVLTPIPALAAIWQISGTGTNGAITNIGFNAGSSIARPSQALWQAVAHG